MSEGYGFVVILVLVVFVVVLMILIRGSDQEEIRIWAKDHGYTVVSCETTVLDNGSFWVRDKYHRIYRTELRDREGKMRVSYFRMGWGLKQDWEN